MEAKIIILWLFALCAAALIDPVQHKTMKQNFEELQISTTERELLEEMEQLNKRIDTLTGKVMADSCKHDLLIKL